VKLATHVVSKQNGKCFAQMGTTSKRMIFTEQPTLACLATSALIAFLLHPNASRALQASSAMARLAVIILWIHYKTKDRSVLRASTAQVEHSRQSTALPGPTIMNSAQVRKQSAACVLKVATMLFTDNLDAGLAESSLIQMKVLSNALALESSVTTVQ
jgi:hypothetical protein